MLLPLKKQDMVTPAVPRLIGESGTLIAVAHWLRLAILGVANSFLAAKHSQTKFMMLRVTTSNVFDFENCIQSNL